LRFSGQAGTPALYRREEAPGRGGAGLVARAAAPQRTASPWSRRSRWQRRVCLSVPDGACGAVIPLITYHTAWGRSWRVGPDGWEGPCGSGSERFWCAWGKCACAGAFEDRYPENYSDVGVFGMWRVKPLQATVRLDRQEEKGQMLISIIIANLG
jgi:hypothetical protein